MPKTKIVLLHRPKIALSFTTIVKELNKTNSRKSWQPISMKKRQLTHPRLQQRSRLYNKFYSLTPLQQRCRPKKDKNYNLLPSFYTQLSLSQISKLKRNKFLSFIFLKVWQPKLRSKAAPGPRTYTLSPAKSAHF